jgi:diguanylate cyclase (GGDEF)-like protein
LWPEHQPDASATRVIVLKVAGSPADALTVGEHESTVAVTDEDRSTARREVTASARGTTVGGSIFVLAATFVGVILAGVVFPDLTGIWQAVAAAAVGGALALPLLFGIAGMAKRRAVDTGSESAARERLMRADATRREFETRLARALEMSDDEDAAYDVVGRAMEAVTPDAPVELLLADNSHAHLKRVVVASADGDAPGCTVGSPDGCVATRRAQTQVFHDSEDLDACPMLRGRDQGRCSGVCVPVSIMGRTVGVIHTTGPVDAPTGDESIAALQTLANQAGNRLGMLRVMAETQLQASTDGLTGLINRRSLENAMHRLRTDGTEFAFVMADLDHFKALNDAHGHEAGDRALRIFSETLRHAMRDEDVACRYGGEEFAIVLANADPAEAIDAIERVRSALALATGRGDTPTFTCSFGVAHSSEAADLEDVILRADRALFSAKGAGRDRICLDGHATPVASTLTALG